ncbi:MAG: hypothetical protein ABII90_00490, partial [Bacteroidota bacterium]
MEQEKETKKEKGIRIAVLPNNANLAEGQVESTKDPWLDMTQPAKFVEEIELAGLDVEGGEVYRILTGIPSPWARAYMMNNALNRKYYPFDQKDQLTGMDTLYAALQNEYKGLIACLALNNSRITVQKVPLLYSDKIDYNEVKNPLSLVENIYEVSGAFGNMLFEDKGLWSNPKALKDDHNPSYFQLIKFDNIVIGATNPRSLIYPAANYNLKSKQISFYKKGRFTDPLEHLEAKKLEKLYHYIGKIKENSNSYDKLIAKQAFKTLNIKDFFREWQQEIREYIEATHPEYNFKEKGILDYCDKFQPPFDVVFNVDTKIYKTSDGRYLIEKEADDMEEFNPDLLLLPVEVSKLVYVGSDETVNLELANLLPAKDDNGNTYYFSLPLSEKGIQEFYHTLNKLLTAPKFPH